jgi:hypothetical protein
MIEIILYLVTCIWIFVIVAYIIIMNKLSNIEEKLKK